MEGPMIAFVANSGLTLPHKIKALCRAVISHKPPVMTVEGKRGYGAILDHYPGSDLSVLELCDALTRKLVQARNSRCVYGPASHDTLPSGTNFPVTLVPFPSNWFVPHNRWG